MAIKRKMTRFEIHILMKRIKEYKDQELKRKIEFETQLQINDSINSKLVEGEKEIRRKFEAKYYKNIMLRFLNFFKRRR